MFAPTDSAGLQDQRVPVRRVDGGQLQAKAERAVRQYRAVGQFAVVEVDAEAEIAPGGGTGGIGRPQFADHGQALDAAQGRAGSVHPVRESSRNPSRFHRDKDR